jgi:hypothetical protein
MIEKRETHKIGWPTCSIWKEVFDIPKKWYTVSKYILIRTNNLEQAHLNMMKINTRYRYRRVGTGKTINEQKQK